jgi:hypothetical protein
MCDEVVDRLTTNPQGEVYLNMPKGKKSKKYVKDWIVKVDIILHSNENHYEAMVMDMDRLPESPIPSKKQPHSDLTPNKVKELYDLATGKDVQSNTPHYMRRFHPPGTLPHGIQREVKFDHLIRYSSQTIIHYLIGYLFPCLCETVSRNRRVG